jgi:hypothetical protein
MNKTLKYILQTLTVILLFGFGLWLRCHYAPARKVKVKTTVKPDTAITIVRYIDSSTHTINHTSEIHYFTKTIIQPSVIDTQAVIRDYYTRKTQQDIYLDSNMRITINDTLFKNFITGRSLNYQILKANITKTRTITNTVTNTVQGKPKGLYMGAVLIPASGIYPHVSYLYGNLQLGIGVLQIHKQFFSTISLQYKIK